MGGKVFKTIKTSPITTEIGNEILSNIYDIMPYQHIDLIGSCLVKKEPCNDLDILVGENDSEFFKIKQLFNNDGIETKDLNSDSFSIAYPLNGLFYQVDFFRTDNIEYASMAAGYDPDTKYKNVHKLLMIEAVIKIIDTQIYEMDNVITRTRYHLDPYFGLMLLVQNKRTGTSSKTRFKTIRKVKISEDWENILIRYFSQYAISIYSFETAFHAVLAKYHFEKDEIFKEAVKLMESCKLVIPDELKPWAKD